MSYSVGRWDEGIIMRKRELGCNSEHETHVGGPAPERGGQVLSEVPEKRDKLVPQVGG